MKSLNEHLIAQLNESKSPKPHTIAWDRNGTPVEIISVLQEGGEDEFVKNYDKSGAMTDELEDLREDIVAGNTTLVAVKLEGGSNHDTAVFVWGPEGVCYENKAGISESHKVNEARTIEYSATLLGVLDSNRMPISVDIIVPAKYQAQFENWAEAEQYNTFEHMEGGDVEY